jgi:hypothetical protein
MNDRIASIAVGLMLLISAAATSGSGNQVSIDIHQEAEGNCVTGEVFIAQVTDAVAFVEGNNNYVEQDVGLYINDNTLMGTEEQPTSLTQFGFIVGNVTGNGNNLNQNLNMNAHNNRMTISNMCQEAAQKVEILGNNNDVSQSLSVDSYDNDLKVSEIGQFSLLKASVVGNDIIVDQSAQQQAEYNSLKGSKIWQKTVGNVSAYGNKNSAYQQIYQDADDNSLTSSTLTQLIETRSPISGSGNSVNQYAKVYAKRNSLTAGAVEVQQILEVADILGIDNSVYHNIALRNTDNAMVGGVFVQESSVITDL